MITNLKTHINRFIALLVSITLLLSSIVTTNVFAGTVQESGKYHSLKDTSSDAQKIINYGKDPGLGIRKLHEQGYTGKGVTIAYIDQPCLTTHEQFRELNLHYSKVRETDTGMQSNASSFHGTTVLSILSGNTVGVAPEAEVYFVANPSWQLDASSNAEALRKLIEINKTLPDERKIRIVGYSTTDLVQGLKNIDDWHKAIQEAEAAGIMVFTCNTPFNFTDEKVTYPADKDTSGNYKAIYGKNDRQNALGVPNHGITTATNDGNNDYTYWESDGGTSWQTPYIVGLVALGLQVDSTLTKDKVVKYLLDSATLDDKGNALVNPQGFIDMVKKNAKVLSANAPKDPYYYVLYNSKKVDDSDLSAIKSFANTYLNNAVLEDVSSYSSAAQIYDMLKTDSAIRSGQLKGIQIFGSAPSDQMQVAVGDVPSFNVGFKVALQNNKVDDMGSMNTDFFYSSFKNDSSILNNKLNLYRIFNEKLNISLDTEWPVARVPLGKGEIAPYLKKYNDFANKTNGTTPALVNFSSPIFATTVHNDDMGQFIKERLDNEFHILSSDQYRLYGNLKGKYPVSTKVLGDVSAENLQKENAKGIETIFINSHGQPDNLDQTTFDKSTGEEKRITFLNKSNINTYLNKNYYNLILWTCNSAFDLRNDTIVHEAMTGNAVNVLASSTVLSNNGVNNTASFDNMKKNNFYYFQYIYFYYCYQLHQSMSDSYFAARKAYIEETLKHTDMLGEGNYQFNLNNALQYQYLGVLEKSDYRPLPVSIPNLSATNVTTNTNTATANSNTASTNSNTAPTKTKKSVKVTYTDDGDNKVTLYIDYKLVTDSKDLSICIYNPPTGDKILVKSNLKASKGTFKTTVDKDTLFALDIFMINFRVNGISNFKQINLSDLKERKKSK